MLVKVPSTHLFTLPLAVTRFVAVLTDVRAESNLIAALLTRGGGAGSGGGRGGGGASKLRSCMSKTVCTYVHID